MKLEKIRHVIKQNKPLKVTLIIFAILSVAYYLLLFFTPGAKFNETFLSRHVKNGMTSYTGSDYYGEYRITVTPIFSEGTKVNQVRFELPRQIDQTYEVSFTPLANREFYINEIKDEKNQILEAPSMFQMSTEVGYVDPFPTNYTVPYYIIGDFATMQHDTLRGNPVFLIIGVMLLIGGIIEMVNPLFFFKLKYMFDVRDPEPTDFYMWCQKIGIIIGLSAGVICLTLALLI